MIGFPATFLPDPAAGKNTSLPDPVKIPQAIGTMGFSVGVGDFIPAVGHRQGKTAVSVGGRDLLRMPVKASRRRVDRLDERCRGKGGGAALGRRIAIERRALARHAAEA